MSTPCEDSVKNQSQTAIVCSAQHCDAFSESDTYHADCAKFHQGNALYPVSTAQCWQPGTGIYVEPVYHSDYQYYTCPDSYVVQVCFCCCSCLAFGTPIAVPGGSKAIELFEVGDSVSVGNLKGSEVAWSDGSVKFSSGTDPGSKSTMIFIQFSDKRQIIATKDNLFLLSTGKLKRADNLVPEKDEIATSDGTALGIVSVQSGEWTKGIHHIATGLQFTGSLDGHLINANGLVTGDYCLQLNQHELVKMGLMDDPSSVPTMGSDEYAAANSDLDTSSTHASGTGDVDVPDGFTPFALIDEIYVPDYAVKFFTDAQADDILNASGSSFRSIHDDSGFESMNHLIKIFKGFYPDVTFTIDKVREDFNTSAFELYGQKHVVISGQILRMNGLFQEAYQFFLAQGIARLNGYKPMASNGCTYVAAADFYAISIILRSVNYLPQADFYGNLVQQMTTLLNLVSPKNAGGTSTDLLNDPGIGCRIGALNTGVFGGSVLPCACSDLSLEAVFSDSAESDDRLVQLIFDKPIDPASVQDLYNFKISSADPSVVSPKVLSADVNRQNGREVVLQVQAPSDKEFVVTVEDVMSLGGSILTSRNSGAFTFSSSPAP